MPVKINRTTSRNKGTNAAKGSVQVDSYGKKKKGSKLRIANYKAKY